MIRTTTALLAAALVTAGCGGHPAPRAPDGGSAGGATSDAGSPDAGRGCVPPQSFPATGFFRVAETCGRPLLVDPQGRPFFSFGVNHVSWNGDVAQATGRSAYHDAVLARYGTEDAWAKATAGRLAAWGWNTAGAWSSDAMGQLMPYTFILNLSGENGESEVIPDFYDPAWQAAVGKAAASGTAGRVDDPNLVGYFLDNELNWGPNTFGTEDLFDHFLALPASAPGKQALVALVEGLHHDDIADFDQAWGQSFTSFADLAAATRLPRATSAAALADRSAFVLAAARRFFQVTTGAVRADDPNHLVLGVRFIAVFAPREVAEAAGEYCDVVSVNDYELIVPQSSLYPPGEWGLVDVSAGPCLEDFWRAGGKPVLVSEFGWRAADSGLPNNWPPIYPTLATQADRADRFEAFAKSCLASPWIVGYHWFEWADEPASGRFDGEDDNWGLVNEADDPYTTVTSRTAAVNVWAP